MFKAQRLLLLLIVLCGLVGCNKHNGSNDKKILSIGTSGTIINIDPQVVSNVNEVKDDV